MAKDKYGNVFAREAHEYKREIDPLKQYVEQAAFMLHKQYGDPIEKCRQFVITNLKPGGAFEFKDPKTVFYHRPVDGNGDRTKKYTTLSTYIRQTLDSKELMAPTFTTYCPPSVRESVLSRYIQGNIKLRAAAKHAMFAAAAAKNRFMQVFKKIEQTYRKLGNNALSGAHVSASTPLVNKTAHSTLTSTCRSTSAYGNANNEKFLSGNRHYFNVDIVINNIVSIVTHFDKDKFTAVMDKYALAYPTTEQTMLCIMRSTSLYWWNSKWEKQIEALVEKLTPLEKAAFVYIGDLWHLMQLNQEFMREFLGNLSRKVTGDCEDPIGLLKKMPDIYINCTHQICSDESRQVEPGKYEKITNRDHLNTIALTAENIASQLWEHRDLIEAFWMTSNLPASVAHFPSSIRRSALTSDTDSTIFTVQDWVKWFSGGSIAMTPQARGIYASTVMLASATITHVLATMSANFGIGADLIFKIAMKSEYSFDVFIPTQLGKHYFACISCQEGLVHDELDWEVKGAQLKSAQAPRPVIKAAEAMMQGIIKSVLEKGSVSLYEWLDYVADQELKILNTIKAGGMEYFRSTSIKDAKSYAGAKEDSPFANHFVWQEVFAPKYGEMPEPPYGTMKINTTIDTSAKMAKWLAEMPDHEFAKRMIAYMQKSGKKYFPTFQIPAEILVTQGIPIEVLSVIDVEKIVVDICGVFYILLETLGYYALGDKTKRLVSNEGWGSHRHQQQPQLQTA